MLALKQFRFIIILLGFVSTLSIVSIKEAQSQARVNIPPLISAPIILTDEGNNILPDGDYFTTIRMINDLTGDIIYQEEHIAEVRKGVAHLVIGMGTAVGAEGKAPAGGLEYSHFLVEGDISVEIMVEGQENPQLLTHLASQPYSFVSDLALRVPSDSISSIHIKNGSISRDDLAPALLEELQRDVEVVEREVALPEDRQLKTRDIELEDGYTMKNSGGHTLDKVLEGIDRSLDTLRDVHIRQRFNRLRLQNIEGVLEDGQIPAVIARDNEVENVINNQIQNLTIENIPGQLEANRIRGRVAEGNIDNSIARDAELRFENIGGQLDPANQIGGRVPANKLDRTVITENEFVFNNIPGRLPDNKVPDRNNDGENDLDELDRRITEIERDVDGALNPPVDVRDGDPVRVITTRIFSQTYDHCGDVLKVLPISEVCVGNNDGLQNIPEMGGARYFQTVTFSETGIGDGFQSPAQIFKYDQPFLTQRVYIKQDRSQTCGEVIYHTGFRNPDDDRANPVDSYCYNPGVNAAPGNLRIKLEIFKETYEAIQN